MNRRPLSKRATKRPSRYIKDSLSENPKVENAISKTEKGFTAVHFLDFLLENLGTKFFGSIQASDESNTNPEVTENAEQLIIDPCAGCGKSLNGTNWGYLHKGVIHKDFCDTCKTELNKDIGEPCPKCGESIEATFQIA